MISLVSRPPLFIAEPVHAQVGRDGIEIVFGERPGSGHQLYVRVPEFLGRRRVFDEFGSTTGDVAAGDRAMPEDVPQTFAELVAYLRNAVVGGTAMRAGVTAVLDQGDLRAIGAEQVIGIRYRTGKSIWCL